MRTYPCSVTGLRYEERAKYVRRKVRKGAALTLKLEPDNPYDANAVAAYHDDFKVGYIPREKPWVAESLREGDRHEVEVTDIIKGDGGELVALDIDITIVEDGKREKRPPKARKAKATPPPPPPPLPPDIELPLPDLIEPRPAPRGFLARLFAALIGK